jgi:phospholipid-translocating ATPase
LTVGPRYLSKAISQIYFPLDKDIIREAWVAGDLKAQLGIRHRYQKNKEPEDANLFQTGHSAESHSEDGSRGGYEPIAHRSPLSRPVYSSTQLPEEQPSPGSESRPPSGTLAASTSQSYFSNYSPSDLPHISPPPIPYMHSLGSSTQPPSPLDENRGRNPDSYEMQNVTFAMTPPGHNVPLDDSHAEQVWYGYRQHDRPSSVYSTAPRAM